MIRPQYGSIQSMQLVINFAQLMRAHIVGVLIYYLSFATVIVHIRRCQVASIRNIQDRTCASKQSMA